MSIFNYTKVNNKMLMNPNLSVISVVMYNKLCFRMQLSINNGNAFYNKLGHFYYVVYSLKEFMITLGSKIGKVRSAMKTLIKYGYVKRHRKMHYFQLELPKFKQPNIQTSKKEMSTTKKTLGVLRINTKNKQYNNTKVNTEPTKNLKFRPMNNLVAWSDNAKTLGLTIDTINHIAKFSNTYNKSAYKITKLIIEARDIVANHNHISKKVRGFETNLNIKTKLGNKIYKLFSYIINPQYTKAKLNNFAGWFINGLKTFFKYAFGLIKPKQTIQPQTNTNHHKIIQKVPNWAKSNYKVHLHPTSKALQAKIKKQLASM